jgi:hypothetical protein
MGQYWEEDPCTAISCQVVLDEKHVILSNFLCRLNPGTVVPGPAWLAQTCCNLHSPTYSNRTPQIPVGQTGIRLIQLESGESDGFRWIPVDSGGFRIFRAKLMAKPQQTCNSNSINTGKSPYKCKLATQIQ